MNLEERQTILQNFTCTYSNKVNLLPSISFFEFLKVNNLLLFTFASSWEHVDFTMS